MLCGAKLALYCVINTKYISTVWTECTIFIDKLIGCKRTEHRHSFGQNAGMQKKLAAKYKQNVS
jgi:hypothetical protein